jgi:hypothetical protein
MNFGLSCRSIQAHVARQLAAAKTREEKALILNSALYDYGHSILKGLEALSQEAGAVAVLAGSGERGAMAFSAWTS